MTPIEFIILLLIAFVIITLQVIALMRGKASGTSSDIAPQLTQLQTDLKRHQQETSERTERQVQNTAQSTRQELTGNLAQFQQTMMAQLTSVATMQNSQIDTSPS